MTAKFDEKKTGGPAFPINYDDGRDAAQGMTLRDYFAAATVQYYIATAPRDATYGDIAEKAYRAADAMLTERGR
jgi:hypothetical protein